MNLLECKFIKLFIRKEFINVIEIISFTTFPEIFHQVPDINIAFGEELSFLR